MGHYGEHRHVIEQPLNILAKTARRARASNASPNLLLFPNAQDQPSQAQNRYYFTTVYNLCLEYKARRISSHSEESIQSSTIKSSFTLRESTTLQYNTDTTRPLPYLEQARAHEPPRAGQLESAKMPSIYDHMTPAQLQTQIYHTHRAARARTAVLIAESKTRRTQIEQVAAVEQEAIVQKTNLALTQSHKQAALELKERMKGAKREEEARIREVRKMGELERQLVREREEREREVVVRALERESGERVRLMGEEAGLRMRLMREESEARIRALGARSAGAIPAKEEEKIVEVQSSLERKRKAPAKGVRKTIGMEVCEVNQKTGEENRNLMATDEQLVARLESLWEGRKPDMEQAKLSWGRTTKVRWEDKTVELRNLYATIDGKDNPESASRPENKRSRERQSSSARVPSSSARVPSSASSVDRRLRVQHPAQPQPLSKVGEDATIELTDATVTTPLATPPLVSFRAEIRDETHAEFLRRFSDETKFLQAELRASRGDRRVGGDKAAGGTKV